MTGSGRPSRTPIGIDVGTRTLKAVQLQSAGGHYRLQRATVVPRLSPGEALNEREVNWLESILRRQGFVGVRVVLAAPAEQVFAEVLELPARSSGAPIEQIARMELARNHNRDPGGFEMCSWDVPVAPTHRESSQNTLLYAAACDHRAANGVMDLFEQVDLQVEALDLRCCAVFRACRSLLAGKTGIRGVLDMGWNGARLGLFYDDVLIFERTFDGVGLTKIHDAVLKRLNVEEQVADYLVRQAVCPSDARPADEDAQPETLGRRDPSDMIRKLVDAQIDKITEEMRVSLFYLNHRYSEVEVEQLLLVGGAATMPGLAEALARFASVKIKMATTATLVECNPAGRWATTTMLTEAIGLAQYMGG